MSNSSTKDHLIDIAEALFAERGFEAVSLRDITGKAKVNVASVNYYFGSKNGLIQAVVLQHFVPINSERMRLLEDLQHESEDGRLELERVLLAFFRPVFDRYSGQDLGKMNFMRLIGRCLLQSQSHLPPWFVENFQEMVEQFIRALHQSLPHLSREQIFWRFHFAIGGLMHSLMYGNYLDQLSQGLCQAEDLGQTLEELVAFTAAGMRQQGGAKA